MVSGWLCIILVFILSLDSCQTSDEKFSIKVSKTYKEKIKKELMDNDFVLLNEITPETYIIKYKGHNDGNDVLKSLSQQHQHSIIAWEPVRLYADTLKPAVPIEDSQAFPHQNLVCSHYYGMGVENVWKQGYTGLNIKIAITSVGINTDLLDLKKNVNTAWSYNFVDDNNDVTPSYYPDPASFGLINHGNMVASVVAAEKDNEICAAGIAYDATILAFKVFKVTISSNSNYSIELQSVTDDRILSTALVHRFEDIDIFVNAWYPTIPFDSSDLSMLEAVKIGATRGRRDPVGPRGLGNIHVVPSGIPGNALSNNIYTITVGGVGINGSLMSDLHRFVDASILVSALAEGNNLTSKRLVTTSYQNHCISYFKGLPAATAIVGGIIALGLQANNRLTLRDVQHLLVISSEHDYLTERNNFKPNGARLYYHDYLGFGLINASKFVDNALKSPGITERFEKRLDMTQNREIDTQYSQMTEVEFCYYCQDLDHDSCVTSVEHVSAYINLTVDTEDFSVTIQSPQGTKSTLIQKHTVNSEIKGTFVSTHFWNELPNGIWKIILQRKYRQDILQVQPLYLTIYGTHSRTEKKNNTEQPSSITLNVSIAIGSLAAFVVVVICIVKSRPCRVLISNQCQSNCLTGNGDRHFQNQPNAETSETEVKLITLSSPRRPELYEESQSSPRRPEPYEESQTPNQNEATDSRIFLNQNNVQISVLDTRSVEEESQTTPVNLGQIKEIIE